MKKRIGEASRVEARLRGAGWFGAFDALQGANVSVEGFGNAALQYANGAKKTLLRLEVYEERDGRELEVHFHVTDERDLGVDFVMRPRERLDELIDAIVAVQEALALSTLLEHYPRLLSICPDCELLQAAPLPDATEASTYDPIAEYAAKLPDVGLPTPEEEAAIVGRILSGERRIREALASLPAEIRGDDALPAVDDDGRLPRRSVDRVIKRLKTARKERPDDRILLQADEEIATAEKVVHRACAELVDRLLRTVLGIALELWEGGGTWAAGVTHDLDLVQEGNIALSQATDTFAPGRGQRFTEYAEAYVRGTLEALRRDEAPS